MNNNINNEYYNQPINNIVYQNNNEKSNKSYKKILLILSVIVIIVIATFIFLNNSKSNNNDNNKTDYLGSIFDPNRPIVVKDNGKFGYISSNGKVLIEPQYKFANSFIGKYALVAIDGTEDSDEVIYQIIDEKGNVKLASENLPEYYKDYNIWFLNDTIYDQNLNKIVKEDLVIDYLDYGYLSYNNYNNESGIMNYKGEIIYKNNETLVNYTLCKNIYYQDDLYVMLDEYENDVIKVISLKTQKEVFRLNNADNYYFTEDEDGIFYYYDKTIENSRDKRKYLFFKDGKLAYETNEIIDDLTVYDYQKQILRIDYGTDYESLGKEEKIYYYDVINKQLLDEPASKDSYIEYREKLNEQMYGYKEFECFNTYGIKKGDTEVVPCEYRSVELLDIDLFNYMKTQDKELALLINKNSTILYNLKDSSIITTFDTNSVTHYDDSTFLSVAYFHDGSYLANQFMVYNLLSNKQMEFPMNDYNFSIESNYITYKKDGKIIYYNTNFEQIYIGDDS